jgi:hypothetical protein
VIGRASRKQAPDRVRAAFLPGGPPGLVFCALFAVVVSAQAQPYAIRWRTQGAPAIEVEGLASERLSGLGGTNISTAEWQRLLAVFAQAGSANPAGGAMPPMAGSWSVAGNCLRFEPRFPLSQGVRYRAEFRPPGGEAPVISFFELPADTAPPSTTVLQVFPTAAKLPENQLKFYVQFSAPMSRGGTYDHVQLRDASGTAIELPFLELDEELWDPTMTRLTLLIDPGRIKRGVKPLEDTGPVFEAGKSYALMIDASCRDAAGRPLRAAFEKQIRIVAADRTPPDPARWKLSAPAAGTREPLVAEFDEPMDHALALRLIGVIAGAEEGRSSAIEGEATLEDHEQRWIFVPVQPWRRGPHRLSVPTTIEDLAGNNIGKPFDVDVAEEGGQRRLANEAVTVAFAIR